MFSSAEGPCGKSVRQKNPPQVLHTPTSTTSMYSGKWLNMPDVHRILTEPGTPPCQRQGFAYPREGVQPHRGFPPKRPETLLQDFQMS
jgi:hypothetical protein